MAEKSLEELLVETEQRILNNEFYKKYIVTYDDEDYAFYVKPVSHKTFMKLYTKHGADGLLDMNEELIYLCLVQKDGTPYKRKLIEILLDEMPAGFANDIARCVFDVSGIETDNVNSEELLRFLERASQL